jgi:hypothetical protein
MPLANILRRVPGAVWWGVPFVVIEVALVSHGFTTFGRPLAPLSYAEPLRPFLIGAGVTIAVFAVNFSLLAVQLSVYRGVLHDIGLRLTSGAVATLLLALAPIVTAAFSERWTATVGMVVLPAITYMAALLTVIASTQASTKPYIRKLCRPSNLNTFVSDFRLAANEIDVDPPTYHARRNAPASS